MSDDTINKNALPPLRGARQKPLKQKKARQQHAVPAARRAFFPVPGAGSPSLPQHAKPTLPCCQPEYKQRLPNRIVHAPQTEQEHKTAKAPPRRRFSMLAQSVLHGYQARKNIQEEKQPPKMYSIANAFLLGQRMAKQTAGEKALERHRDAQKRVALWENKKLSNKYKK